MSDRFIPVGFPGPKDVDAAHKEWDLMCGHAALAAALKMKSFQEAKPLFNRGGWVNIPIMQEAIKRAGRKADLMNQAKFTEGHHWKYRSVILVNWLGPWSSDSRSQCHYRHWVAQVNRMIYDVNLNGWVSMDDWQKWVPELYPEEATGFQFYRALVLL